MATRLAHCLKAGSNARNLWNPNVVSPFKLEEPLYWAKTDCIWQRQRAVNKLLHALSDRVSYSIDIAWSIMGFALVWVLLVPTVRLGAIIW